MASLPLAFLTQTIAVVPYVGISDVAVAPVNIPCLVDKRVGRKIPERGKVGEEPSAEITIYAPLSANIPIGSKITLPDGRFGYASAMSKHTGGGLATPDHTEILWSAGWTGSEVDEFE